MYRWQRRSTRQEKKKNRMPVHGQGVFVLAGIAAKKAEKAKEKK